VGITVNILPTVASRLFLAMSLCVPGIASAQAAPTYFLIDQAPSTTTRPAAGTGVSVQTGYLPCELGQSVLFVADPHQPGQFKMQLGPQTLRFRPVVSKTGVLRLEDDSGQFVWIELGHKSMLLDQRSGTRLLDECASPQQVAYGHHLAANPRLGLLD
jgi:hypothetical protein